MKGSSPGTPGLGEEGGTWGVEGEVEYGGNCGSLVTQETR